MDKSQYGSASWQKMNVDEQNKQYGIPRVKLGSEKAVERNANKQEPAGPSKGNGYI